MSSVTCKILKQIMKKTSPNPFKNKPQCNCITECNFTFTVKELETVYVKELGKCKFGILTNKTEYKSPKIK